MKGKVEGSRNDAQDGHGPRMVGSGLGASGLGQVQGVWRRGIAGMGGFRVEWQYGLRGF